jgi:hypothetical protein
LKWPKKKDKKRQPQNNKNKIFLTNSTAQYRKPDQHNNQKYIGTIKKINLIWL